MVCGLSRVPLGRAFLAVVSLSGPQISGSHLGRGLITRTFSGEGAGGGSGSSFFITILWVATPDPFLMRTWRILLCGVVLHFVKEKKSKGPPPPWVVAHNV